MCVSCKLLMKGETRVMNQQKIGTFLKELRNEKKLTQDQLAEKLGVSRRTVSRWETGSNMPDLDILIEMADYYEVDLRELLDGERKSGTFIFFFVVWFMEPEDASFMYGYLEGVTLGIPLAAVLAGAIMTGKNAVKFRAFKERILDRGIDG